MGLSSLLCYVHSLSLSGIYTRDLEGELPDHQLEPPNHQLKQTFPLEVNYLA